MARMKKAEVIAALKKAGIQFDTNGKYNNLCKLLKSVTTTEPKTELPPSGGTVRIENRRKKRNTFLADSVRDEADRNFLNAEISKRKYKGKLKTITTIKHCNLIDGDWVTEFIIDLK